MPIYQYYCDECQSSFEARRRFNDEPLTTCPAGHEGTVRRVFEPAGIIFKGSGWYIKDSKASSGGSEKSDSASSNSGSSE